MIGPRTVVRGVIAAAVAAVVLGSVNRTWARDEVQVYGQKQQHPFLTLDPFYGSLALDTVVQSDSLKNGDSSTTSQTVLMEEKLTLATGAAILSKNFLDLRTSVTLGLSEAWTTGTSTSSEYGILQAYDLSAALLKNSMVPVTVYARRTESFINRSFVGLLKNDVTQYGADVTVRSEVLPTTLRIYRTETQQSALNGENQFTLNENNVDLHSEYTQLTNQTLSLDYHYTGIQQTNSDEAANTFDTHQLDLSHTIDFTGSNQYTLSSTLNYSLQSGTYSFERLRIDELLRMRHTQDFETWVNETLNKESINDSQDIDNRVSTGFTHHLFDSLTTNGRVGYEQDQRNDGGSSRSTFWDVGSGYTKLTPLGRLSLSVSLGESQMNTDEIGVSRQVIGEAHAFNDPFPVVLNQQNINSASIAVFDATNTRQFVSGTDYTVTVFPSRIEINRVITGAIANGQSVLVNYQVNPSPATTTATTSYGFGARFDFDAEPLRGLGLYGRYSNQSQEVISSGPMVIKPDNVTDVVVGADYRIWKLMFNAEQEWRESTLSPYNSLRFSARYSDRLSGRSRLTITAHQSFIDYPDEGTQLALTQLDGRLEYDITRNLRSSISSEFRYETQSGEATMGFDEQADLRWVFRQTQVYLSIRYSLLEAQSSQEQTLFLTAGIQRNF